MRRLIALVITAIAAFLAVGYSIPTGTVAHFQEDEFTVQLSPLNDSGTRGSATIELDDGQATVVLNVSGASAGLPHAQHIHIVAEGESVCPGPETADDRVDDGFIDTAEGLDAYGAIRISLTTEGDVTDASGLAVPRFPVANANGSYTYVRTFDLPDGVDASDIARGEIVVHGISKLFDDPNAYDGLDDGESSIAAGVPLEVTIPAACGPVLGEEELEDIEDQQEEDAEATEEAIEEQEDQAEEDAEATQEAIEEQEEANAEATEAAQEQAEDNAEATREAIEEQEEQAEEDAEATQEAIEEQEEANAEATEAAQEQAEEDAEATQEALEDQEDD